MLAGIFIGTTPQDFAHLSLVLWWDFLGDSPLVLPSNYPQHFRLHKNRKHPNPLNGDPIRSPQGEILDPDNEPTASLYSSGVFGSIWSGTYQGGGNIAECLIFGRISARSALANA